jgi:integrase
MLDKPRQRHQGGSRAPLRYARNVASVPAAQFNGPQAPRAWREQMMHEGVSKPTRDQAWSVLSAALSWAAGSQLVPEIQTNGCGLANEPRVNRRRSMRHGGTGYAPAGRRHGLGVLSWALSPQAVEAIRAQMLTRVTGRPKILAQRDAIVVSLQYGLGARNQEIWGLRWASLNGEFAWVLEVLSCGQLHQWGKTEHSTQRRTAIPGILRDDLTEWRAALIRAGHAAREYDFIIPGDLADPRYGVREVRTGACHLSASQAKAWGTKYFTPAVKKVAERPEFFPILGATPYSLRRGGISLRLRAEDPQTVASECGTSLKMLSDHYAFAIEDLRRHGPRPADIEWHAARAEQAAHDTPETPSPTGEARESARPRGKVLGWLAAHRRRAGVA